MKQQNSSNCVKLTATCNQTMLISIYKVLLKVYLIMDFN